MRTGAFKILRSKKRLFWAVIIISIMGIGITVGPTSVYPSLKKSLDKFLADYKCPDYTVVTELIDKQRVKNILNVVNGVEQVDCRLVIDANMRVEGRTLMSARIYTQTVGDFQTLYTVEKDESETLFNLTIDSRFANSSGLKCGDQVQLSLDGEWIDCAIGTIIETPQSIVSQKDSFMFGDSTGFCNVYLPAEYLGTTELKSKANLFEFSFKEGADTQRAIREILQIFNNNGVEIISEYDFDNSPLGSKIAFVLNAVKVSSQKLPLIFFVVLIFISSLFFSQIVIQLRRENGILIANGFSRKDVCLMYHKLAFIVSLISVLPGLAFAFFICVFSTKGMSMMFGLSNILYHLDVKWIIINLLGVFVATQISVLLSCKDIKKLDVAKVITSTNIANASFKTPELKVFRKKPVVKYSVLTSIRKPGRFILGVICLSSVVLALYAALAFNGSKESVFSELYEVRLHYDARAVFTEKPNSAFIKRISNLKGVTDVELAKGWIDDDTTYMAVQEDSDLVTIVDNGHALKINYISYEDSDNNPDYWFLLIKTDNISLLDQFLESCKSLRYVSYLENNRLSNRELFDFMSMITYILIICSILMCFVIVYNSTLNRIYEQKHDICVLRSQGLNLRSLSKSFAVSLFIQYIFALLIGIPLGGWIIKLILDSVGSNYFEYIASFSNMAFTAVVALVAAILSHLIAMREAARWNLSYELKDKT